MAEPIRCAYEAQETEPFYVGATPAALSHTSLVATPMNDDIFVTDLTTNTVVHRLEGDGETVTALAITPDGTRLAAVSQSQQLRIYDVQLAKMIKQYKFSAPVYIATADATSTLFAFGATDGLVSVWDIEGGYVTHALKGHGTTICSLQFYGELHSTDWMLALGDTMGTCKAWNLSTRKCVATQKEHSGAVRGLAFLDDGEYFMSGGRDAVVVVYRRSNMRKPLNTFSVRHQVEACGFLADSGRLLFYTAGTECHLKLWDFERGTPLGGSPKPHDTQEEVMVSDLARNGDSVWMTLSDQTLVELDLGSVHDNEGTLNVPVARTVAGNHGIIADIRYCGPDLQRVALATNAPALRIVDPHAPLDVQFCEGHTDLLNCLDASEDGLWLLTGSKDHTARLWRWDFGTQRFENYATFTGHAGAVTGCGMTKHTEPFPRYVFTASADLTVKKWKVPLTPAQEVKSSEYTRRAHDKEINALAVAPNDEYFGTASFDKTAKIWSAASGETVGILRGHKRGLWDLSFCQYDKVVVTGLGDKTVKVWLMSDYTCKKTLEGHTNSVQRCRFITKNRQVVSSGADGLIKVWDVNESECVATLDNHSNRIWAMDTKADGAAIVSADADGYMSLWSDTTQELVAQREREQRERVEQEQLLANHISRGEWSSAFLLALTLEHLMRLYNVVRALIAANADGELAVGSRELEATMQRLEPQQMTVLLKKVRDWNINFKQFEIAQKVLAVVLDRISMDGECRKIVDQIIPYNERHFLRVEDLLETVHTLDYVVQEMEA